jgi:hypothetical protein
VPGEARGRGWRVRVGGDDDKGLDKSGGGQRCAEANKNGSRNLL